MYEAAWWACLGSSQGSGETAPTTPSPPIESFPIESP